MSFLVTHAHLEKMWKEKLIDFIIDFMEVRRSSRALELSPSRGASSVFVIPQNLPSLDLVARCHRT